MEEAIAQPTTPSLQLSHDSIVRVTVIGKCIYTKHNFQDLLLLPCSTGSKSRVHSLLRRDEQHPSTIEMR